ncbi:MAG: hypothetical protein PUF48_03720 [Oscillospiraceae bacterium]|nr:hypothetical protein [Oscillospiraceae bacterium]
MKYIRKQKVGNIQFIVESNFKSKNAVSTKELLSKIILNKAKEYLRSVNKLSISQN